MGEFEMKMPNDQLKLQVLERDQRKSSLLAETSNIGKVSPGGEEERRGAGPGGVRASSLARCAAHMLSRPFDQHPGCSENFAFSPKSRPCRRGEGATQRSHQEEEAG